MSVSFICSIKHLSTFIKWTPNSVHGGQRFFDEGIVDLTAASFTRSKPCPWYCKPFFEKNLEHTVPYFFKIWFIFDKT